MSALAPSPLEAAEKKQTRPPRLRWTTPAVLKAATAAVVLASVLFAATATVTSAQVHSGFDAIGHMEAPQVVATNELAYSLNDMDANLANILMVGEAHLGPGIDRASFTKLYEQDRDDADHDLQLAAVHAGTDGAAAGKVRQALDALGDYEATAAQVMYLDAQHTGRQPGQVPADEQALYAKATDLMQNSVLPAAKAVAASNGDAMETSYQSKHSQAETAVWWITGTCILLLAALAGFQLVITKRTRRLLNPALAGATVLTLAVMIWGAASMSSAAEDLRGAKKDAFDSVSALTAAKALSTDANADESRIIVDPGRADAYRSSYLAKTQQLMDLGPGVTLNSYDSALQGALDAYNADPVRHPVTFGGYFGTELKNITFPGERAAAENMLKTYQVYELDDRKLRQKIGTDLQEAIRYDTSPAASDSDGAFVAYTGALQAVIDINTKAFDASITSGLAEMSPWIWVPLAAAALVVVLALIGVRPRLTEYR